MPLFCIGWIWSTRYGLKLYKPHLVKKEEVKDVSVEAVRGLEPVPVDEESKQVELG